MGSSTGLGGQDHTPAEGAGNEVAPPCLRDTRDTPSAVCVQIRGATLERGGPGSQVRTSARERGSGGSGGESNRERPAGAQSRASDPQPCVFVLLFPRFNREGIEELYPD